MSYKTLPVLGLVLFASCQNHQSRQHPSVQALSLEVELAKVEANIEATRSAEEACTGLDLDFVSESHRLSCVKVIESVLALHVRKEELSREILDSLMVVMADSVTNLANQ